MALADRFSPVEAGTAPRAAVSCLRYDPVPGTRRCRHYLSGGACDLPDEFMCVEWLRANGHAAPPPLPPMAQAAEPPPVEAPPRPAPPRVGHDLFGLPLPAPTPAPRPVTQAAPAPARPPTPQRGLTPAEASPPRALTDDDLASFKALGVEVCLQTEACGEVWLVPEYTDDAARRELSVRDAATLAAICAAFPGARVTRFERPDPASRDQGR